VVARQELFLYFRFKVSLLRIKILYLFVMRLSGRYIDSSFRMLAGPASCTSVRRYSQPSFRKVGLTSCTLDSRCIDLGPARTIFDDRYIEPSFRLVGLARTPFNDRYIWPSFRQAAAITSYLQRASPRGSPQDFRLSCLSRK
jgi:hypothetical protein